jgi:DNA-binding SARP family transcriptional activator
MRASLLESVEPELAAVVAEVDTATSRDLIATAERFGLLARKTTEAADWRFHPLVRQFLEARLGRESGREEVQRLHLRAAEAARPSDWRAITFHLLHAGSEERAAHSISSALDLILANGDYETAERYVDRLSVADPAFDVIRSRGAYRRGDLQLALQLAKRAVEHDPSLQGAALNLLSLSFSSRDLEQAGRFAADMAVRGTSDQVRSMGRLYEVLIGSSLTGSLREAIDVFLATAEANRQQGHHHYEGIALTNAAVMLRATGNASLALSIAGDALAALGASSSGPERSSARMVRAWALAHLGSLPEGREEAKQAVVEAGEINVTECSIELAEIEIWYGTLERARQQLDGVEVDQNRDPDQHEQVSAAWAHLFLRERDFQSAVDVIGHLRPGRASTAAGMEARRLAILAHVAAATGSNNAWTMLAEAELHARRQDAVFWQEYVALLVEVYKQGPRLGARFRSALLSLSPFVSILADDVLLRFCDMEPELQDQLAHLVRSQPDRWRETLRRHVHTEDRKDRLTMWSAQMLDAIGEKSDVATLRQLSRKLSSKGDTHDLGKRLARSLADRVVIHDQGRVSISIGSQQLPGSRVRRKALALLCFLLTRPQFSANRDEVLDALWPEMNPRTALNSLNQTIYFLRRTLEPGFREDLSPGYVHYQSDMVWLDPELVDSDTARCRRLLLEITGPAAAEDVGRLSDLYKGRFALDFAYEEWSVDYRESLHAAYLALIEGSIRQDVALGQFVRAANLARRALQIDPEAHQIEQLLVKIYRLSGSHAAAAEQYSHYAASLQEDLGVDPPPIDEL